MSDIISTLKNARKALGISQAELGSRIGVPQSHISKIESGNSDIQLSSLVQIARALDFELQLVPKKALPAVQSIVRSTMPRINPSEHAIPRVSIPKSAHSLDNDDE